MYRSKSEKNFVSILSEVGHEFNTNVKGLPGTPDVVFVKQRLCLFFNGCYWHSHGCRETNFSKAIINRKKYEMLAIRNKDLKNYELLRSMDYFVHVVWDCEFQKNKFNVLKSIERRLSLAEASVCQQRKPLLAC